MLGRSPGEGKAPHSSILAWRSHGLYSPWGYKETDTTERLRLSRSHTIYQGILLDSSPEYKKTLTFLPSLLLQPLAQTPIICNTESLTYLPALSLTLPYSQSQRMLKLLHNCTHLTR